MVFTNLFILLPERHCFIFLYVALLFPVLFIICNVHMYLIVNACIILDVCYPRELQLCIEPYAGSVWKGSE